VVREKIRITEEQYVNHWKYRNHEILEETAQESFLSLIESQHKEKMVEATT
jgi:ribosomal protein L13